MLVSLHEKKKIIITMMYVASHLSGREKIPSSRHLIPHHPFKLGAALAPEMDRIFTVPLLAAASSSVWRDVGPSVRTSVHTSVTKEENSGFRVHF